MNEAPLIQIRNLSRTYGDKLVLKQLNLGIVAAIGFAHYLSMKWEMLIWILIIPALTINVVMFHYYKKQSWENIELSEI